MASQPWFDKRRGTWVMKYKTAAGPAGEWRRVTLCKHPGEWSPKKPPRKPPPLAIERAREYEEKEYRILNGLEAGEARAKGLAGYVASYLDAYRSGHDPASIAQAERVLRLFVEFAAARGVSSVQEVTRSLCRDWLAERARTVCCASLHTEKGYASPLFSRAVDDELIPANPWTRIKVPGKKQPSDPTFWAAEEIRAILRECRTADYADLCMVLVNTGIRVSATLEMRWDWVDWKEGTISVPAEHSKSGVPYSVSLSRAARDVLARRQARQVGRGRLVFPHPTKAGKTLQYDAFRTALARICARAKVKPGTPHDFRHTFARTLVASGAPMNVVQASLGHSTLKMTQVYTNIGEEHARPHLADFGIGDEDQPGEARPRPTPER